MMNTHQKHSATGQGQVMQPGAMTDAECLDKLAQLLATGLVRAVKRSEKYCQKREIFRDNCLAVPAKKGPDVAGH